MTPAFDLEQIRKTLHSHHPRILPSDRGHASVAMLLNQSADRPAVLFIQRASHDRDPWSGDIGFPGGRLEAHESDPRLAAERETHEELGLLLNDADFFGQLDDLYGATLPILVSCFVYHLPTRSELTPNHEVANTFWFPLDELLNPDRHHQATLTYRGQAITHPAVDLLGPDQTVLWGITYRLIRQFFTILGHDFGSPKVAIDARP
jgi:8-oxo-dGTP pyrophosphatase MutT (NUDIX family)